MITLVKRKQCKRGTAKMFVTVYSFQFEFSYVGQLDDMIRKFSQSHRGGEQVPGYAGLAGHSHSDAQSSFSMLPQWLKAKQHRPRVLKVLKEARAQAKFITDMGSLSGMFVTE